jgi:hypothetical protein
VEGFILELGGSCLEFLEPIFVFLKNRTREGKEGRREQNERGKGGKEGRLEENNDTVVQFALQQKLDEEDLQSP